MKLDFKPKQVSKNLLGALKDRARDIIERRYGLLNDGSEQMTLEAIGQIYGITRERVRQIENFAIETIRKSEVYKKSEPVFQELEDQMVKFGGLVKEEEFLAEISKDKGIQNHVNFLLVLGESFVRIKEDDHFHHRWTTDTEHAEKVHTALHNLYKNLNEEELISETEMILRFVDHLKSEIEQAFDEEMARRWLSISKHVGKNSLGEWGLSHSPNVKTRGMRDLAYLVLRRSGKPMHFREVAKEIFDAFGREAHIATTHNELIKDERFVLVGRGLYALSEWGYTSGVVRDVIKSVLKKKGALTKDEVVKEVLKQRHVKENTIYVNLQNNRHFKKDTRGRYSLA